MRGFSFSLKRFVGITQIKQQIAQLTGVPTTKGGLERKIGGAVIKALFGRGYFFRIDLWINLNGSLIVANMP